MLLFTSRQPTSATVTSRIRLVCNAHPLHPHPLRSTLVTCKSSFWTLQAQVHLHPAPTNAHTHQQLTPTSAPIPHLHSHLHLHPAPAFDKLVLLQPTCYLLLATYHHHDHLSILTSHLIITDRSAAALACLTRHSFHPLLFLSLSLHTLRGPI